MREIPEELNRLAKRALGAAIEVPRALGPGYLEKVYDEALAFELQLPGIAFAKDYPVAAVHKGHDCGQGKLDSLVGGALVVELKTVERFDPIHQAQAISCLKVTNLDLGLLRNFHVPVLKDGIKRVMRAWT